MNTIRVLKDCKTIILDLNGYVKDGELDIGFIDDKIDELESNVPEKEIKIDDIRYSLRTLADDIWGSERDINGSKIELSELEYEIRKNTDFAEVFGKAKPTISEIQSYIDNDKEFKLANNGINEEKAELNYYKKLYEIELAYLNAISNVMG